MKTTLHVLWISVAACALQPPVRRAAPRTQLTASGNADAAAPARTTKRDMLKFYAQGTNAPAAGARVGNQRARKCDSPQIIATGALVSWVASPCFDAAGVKLYAQLQASNPDSVE